MFNLEETNLFKINLIQDNEQTLEKIKKESTATIAARQAKIDEVDKNIQMLILSRGEREKKHKYYMNVLNSSEQNQSTLPSQKSGLTATAATKSTGETNKDLPDQKSGGKKVEVGTVTGPQMDKLGFRKPTMSALDRRL